MASNISVIFQAFTEKFEQKTAKAGKSVDSFGKKALKIGAGFLAARAGVAQFSNSLSRLNELSKISQSLNVSPDFLRGLKLGTAEVGESFEKAQDLIKEFNIRMGEAKTGAGPALEGLKLLGLTMDDIGDSSPEEAFLKVSDAISKMGDEQKKIFAAGDIFGGAGEDALSVLNLGAEGLKKAIADARELGGPISKDDLAAIEKANAATVRMGLAFEGIIDQLTIQFAPALEGVADSLTGLIQLVKLLGDAWKNTQKFVEDFALAVDAEVQGAAIALEFALGNIDQSTFDAELKRIADELAAAIGIKLGGGSGLGKGKGGGGKDELNISAQSIKTFAVAATAGSSAAFDQLNPNSPSSIQGKQLGKLDSIDKGIKELVDKDAAQVNFKQVSIPGA